MDENVVNNETPVEETVAEETTAKKPAAKPAKKGEHKPVAEKKKPGLFTRVKDFCGRHKEAIYSGIAGIGVGVAGSIGAAQIGKKRAERNQRNAYIPQDGENYTE